MRHNEACPIPALDPVTLYKTLGPQPLPAELVMM